MSLAMKWSLTPIMLDFKAWLGMKTIANLIQMAPRIIMVFALLAGFAQADPVPVALQGSDIHGESAYPPPVVPLDRVLNPPTPLSGNYPVHSSGIYAGDWFWMDNRKIIFWTYEEAQTAKDVITRELARLVGQQKADQYQLHTSLLDVTKIWDVDSGSIIQYGPGRVSCYQDGIINIYIPEAPPETGFLMTGPMGHEKPVDMSSRSRWYMYLGDCGDQPSTITKQYMEVHPDEYVQPLRKLDGFIVLGKHRDKNRGPAIPQDFITFYPVGKSPLKLPLYNNIEGLGDYYPFANAYNFGAGRMGFGKNSTVKITSDVSNSVSADYVPSFHILKPDGELRKVKVPDLLIEKGANSIFLSRRGVLWSISAFWGGEPGIYLSRGEEVRKISQDGVANGKVSPDGCRFAYMELERNQFPLDGKFKVIDLCEGIQ